LPIVEALTLWMVMWRRPANVSIPAGIDAFFAGYAPWTLLLIGLAATWAFVHPSVGWTLTLRIWVWIAVVVIAWSAYIDFCFFRYLVGSTRAAAVRQVVVHRLPSWMAIFAIFAFPSMTRWGLAEVVEEVLRR
jgi:hypothetical protein